ncbi:calcium-binding protein [Novosphingobium sp.]|uniref:calcium-binding protein n=1 Tax=Novosphingobium sp. TaxID=1874826 RepID=UPI0025D84ABF|nr:calcium-binding protein [Novosphingobium sp.]
MTLAALGAADFVFDTSTADRFEFGTAGNDVMFGGTGHDDLIGGGGADKLLGGDGADLLDGGDGADEMIGGDGDDTYFVDSPEDTIIEAAETGGFDKVASTITFVLDEVLEALDLKGSAHIDGTGNARAEIRSLATPGSNVLRGLSGDDVLYGEIGTDRLEGGSGNDALNGGSGIDTAVVSGNRSAYTVTQPATGAFSVTGPDGTDSLINIEYLQFADQTIRLYPGAATTVNFAADNPASYMAAIRDFNGNDVGAAADWKRIGSADVNGDGDVDQILVNRTNGRFAEVATAPDGKVYFSDHGWAGETRVVGIYIDPLVQSGQVVAGGPNDNQRRFQNDLKIENINGVLGAGDYDRDGLQEVYFKLTDGTAYSPRLHARRWQHPVCQLPEPATGDRFPDAKRLGQFHL